MVLNYDEYIRRPFWRGEDPKSPYGGAAPINRPGSAPPYDPSAPRGSSASIRDWYSGDTIPMNRFGSVGPLTGAESLYPSQVDVSVVDNILNVIRDKSLSQYVVGFAPASSVQQRKHSLEVKLKSKSVGKLTGGKRTGVY